MGTDADLSKSTNAHAREGFFDSSDCLAFTQCRNVVNEYLAVVTTNPFIGDSAIRRHVVYRHFVTAIEKNSDIVNDCISGHGCRSEAFHIF